MSGFYVVWHFFGQVYGGHDAEGEGPGRNGGAAEASGGSGSAALQADAVLGSAQAFCSMPWRSVAASLGEHVNVERYCLWGPYAVMLLHRGLAVPKVRVRVNSCIHACAYADVIHDYDSILQTGRCSQRLRGSLHG